MASSDRSCRFHRQSRKCQGGVELEAGGWPSRGGFSESLPRSLPSDDFHPQTSRTHVHTHWTFHLPGRLRLCDILWVYRTKVARIINVCSDVEAHTDFLVVIVSDPSHATHPHIHVKLSKCQLCSLAKLSQQSAVSFPHSLSHPTPIMWATQPCPF